MRSRTNETNQKGMHIVQSYRVSFHKSNIVDLFLIESEKRIITQKLENEVNS